MVIAVEQHRPHVMAFRVASDHRSQRVTATNRFADGHAMVKIQSASSKKFRVRLAFGALPPDARVGVSIMLSSAGMLRAQAQLAQVYEAVARKHASLVVRASVCCSCRSESRVRASSS